MGKHLAFLASPSSVYVLDPETRLLRQITPATLNVNSFIWSPGGLHLACVVSGYTNDGRVMAPAFRPESYTHLTKRFGKAAKEAI